MNIIKDKAAFFEVAKRKTEEVQISDDAAVIAQELGAPDFVTIWLDPACKMEGDDEAVDLRKVTPKLVVASIVNEDGERIFADEDAVDLEQRTGSWIYNRMCAAVQRVNGVVAVPGKNSEAIPVDGSSSDSPSS